MAFAGVDALFRPVGRSGTRWPPTVALPGTYRVQHDSLLLAEHVRRHAAGRSVLDVCTGTGFLALTARQAGATDVVAVDLAHRSVLSARLNSVLSRSALTVRRGDLFAPVIDRRFDLVVCNPPYVPSPTDVLPRHRAARCWDGGTSGRLVLDRVCAGAAQVLAGDGRLLLVHSTVTGVEATLERLDRHGMHGEVVARRTVPFGPVMTQRGAWLHERGLLDPQEQEETLVVVEGRRRRREEDR
ncbi:HemK2/MTQ2 family protein methyltransferase [Desertihabitans brevis]|uniref:HemK2/MTQ2 family protein methyltransferase n=1 Tax=Desertihabitans brevis TaxID=2268447 RepID=UPI0018F3182D|nr:HemK2/MTQ2 family protein methyltransferase [Desertihabitans brevis]